MKKLKERVIDYLIELKKEYAQEIQSFGQKADNILQLCQYLLESNIVSEEEVIYIFTHEYKIPYLDLTRLRIPEQNKFILPKEIAFRYKVVPISKIGPVLTVATANPLDVIVKDDLRMITDCEKIVFVLSFPNQIEQALNALYLEKESLSFWSGQGEDDASSSLNSEKENSLEQVIQESNLPPIIRLVDLIIYEGLNKKASDIHIEPTEEELVVRYRIDGILHYGLSLSLDNSPALLARLKLMSSMDITEFRIPQDGRFKVNYQGRQIDFRVSTLPTQFGEKVVLRILDRKNLAVGVHQLGFSSQALKLFEQSLTVPFGIILVTGPTGSGKSTTLYSVLTQMNTPDKNIITIEDPVEYQLEGITQIQVRSDIGLTFASALRSILRQSPDIVMVGEIRDVETADIAIKASLTGHLIFATLHTNTSVGAITRLIDMGIEPFLVASSLIATTAQRLVRKLCPHCRQSYSLTEEEANYINIPPGTVLFKAQGCEQCRQTGYQGRTALLEVLLIDDTIREMISQQASEDDIVAYARQKKGFFTLREDGINLCQQGITSLEEVLRVS